MDAATRTAAEDRLNREHTAVTRRGLLSLHAAAIPLRQSVSCAQEAPIIGEGFGVTARSGPAQLQNLDEPPSQTSLHNAARWQHAAA